MIIVSYSSVSTQENDDGILLNEINENSITPEGMLYDAAKVNKVIIYGEIHIMAQPKEFLYKTIKTLNNEYRFNYLALEIGEKYQPIVDKYLETGNELILRKNPWTLFSPMHASEQYLKIYKSVYQINKVSNTKMKIVCIDYDPVEYSQNYELIRDRDNFMMKNLNEKVFSVDEDAKLIIFIGAYHSLKNNVWELMKELDPYGIMFKSDPLGVHLNKAFPGKVFSFYIDGIVPKSYDNLGVFLSQIGTLYEQHLIMAPVPFAININNDIKLTELSVMKKIPIKGNFDGYMFVGDFEELKLINLSDWANKKDKSS
jgi:hypothetical protein